MVLNFGLLTKQGVGLANFGLKLGTLTQRIVTMSPLPRECYSLRRLLPLVFAS